MALNSYVYVPMGLPASERAKLLGHSVETNLKYYTFARTDEYIDELCEKINAFDDETRENPIENDMGTSGYLKIVPFQAKEKSLESARTQAFI